MLKKFDKIRNIYADDFTLSKVEVGYEYAAVHEPNMITQIEEQSNWNQNKLSFKCTCILLATVTTHL